MKKLNKYPNRWCYCLFSYPSSSLLTVIDKVLFDQRTQVVELDRVDFDSRVRSSRYVIYLLSVLKCQTENRW